MTIYEELLKLIFLIYVDVSTLIVFNLIFLAIILTYGMEWTNILLIFYIIMIFSHIYLRLHFNRNI